jgi:hypothetical protein
MMNKEKKANKIIEKFASDPDKWYHIREVLLEQIQISEEENRSKLDIIRLVDERIRQRIDKLIKEN